MSPRRPFTVALIPHTNLILVVADTECPCYSARLSVEPKRVEYGIADNETNISNYCLKLKYNVFMRRPHQCIKYHSQVIQSWCGCGVMSLSCVILSWYGVMSLS